MSFWFRIWAFLQTLFRAKGSAHVVAERAKQARTMARNFQNTQMERVREKADQGDPKAQYELGERFYEGRGVPQDLPQALVWFREAAQQGDAKAQCNLGMMYFLGRGVGRDPVHGYLLIHQAANQGLTAAIRARETARSKLSEEEWRTIRAQGKTTIR